MASQAIKVVPEEDLVIDPLLHEHQVSLTHNSVIDLANAMRDVTLAPSTDPIYKDPMMLMVVFVALYLRGLVVRLIDRFVPSPAPRPIPKDE
jgi:hypothetical protein